MAREDGVKISPISLTHNTVPNGDPYGIRTRVAGVRGRSLRPLDQRATAFSCHNFSKASIIIADSLSFVNMIIPYFFNFSLFSFLEFFFHKKSTQ